MVGLLSGFPETSENQLDVISEACHEFKTGNERCDVVFRLLSTDEKMSHGLLDGCTSSGLHYEV